MPIVDAQAAEGTPGRFFADHPVVYRLSLTGSSGACAYALIRVGRPRGGRRRLWAAMAALEAGITVGIVRARRRDPGAQLVAILRTTGEAHRFPDADDAPAERVGRGVAWFVGARGQRLE